MCVCVCARARVKGASLDVPAFSEENCGLKALVREAYKVLGLQTYFTTGVRC